MPVWFTFFNLNLPLQIKMAYQDSFAAGRLACKAVKGLCGLISRPIFDLCFV
jgi:hypothetical protein